MNRLPPTLVLEDVHAPLPSRQFTWLLLFWHIVYIGMLLVELGSELWRGLDGRTAIIAICVALQIAIYLYTFIFYRSERWPLAWSRLLFYFGVSIALWQIEIYISPEFRWMAFAYVGQLMGNVPLKAAIPSAIALALLALVSGFGLTRMMRLSFSDFIGIALGFGLWLVFGIFFALLMRTSTQRRQLIAKLEAANRELEVARQRDVELATLRERERLARDMHDGLGHTLVALTVQLEAVQRLIAVDPARATTQIETLKQLTRDSMDELRRSLDGLRASGLGKRPLTQALQSLSVEVGQRMNIELTCHADETANTLTPALSETLWRVAQEGLTNVEKHSRARHVQVNLEVQPSYILLRINDDGVGLAHDALDKPHHYGVRGLRERVEGLGGTLTLMSDERAGMVLEARLPIIRER